MNIYFNDFNKKILNKRYKKGKSYIERAEQILNNKYLFFGGFDIVHFPDHIDWNYNHHISRNSYQLYMHTLNFMNHLVFAYLETKNEAYIEKAKVIIEDWYINNHNKTGEITNHAWYDHTVSKRITNILFFQLNVPVEYKLGEQRMQSLLVKHISFLADESNYSENNHGLMMDKALILSVIFIEEEDLKKHYINISKTRVEKALLRDYSYRNIHLENSPDYHHMVTTMLTDIDSLFREVKHPLGNLYKQKITDAIQYKGIVSNYNNVFPMLGDTAYTKTKASKLSEDLVDYEAGIAVFNDQKKKSTLVFNCGFESRTHKHYDDLSFVFSVGNDEIFIDSGKYNYSGSDSIRKHIISPKAHTTFCLKDKSYKLDNRKLGVVNFFKTKRYKYVLGYNNAYNGTSIRRHLILIGGDNLIIIDQVNSNEQNTYIQNFILNDDIKVEKLGMREYKIVGKQSKFVFKEHSEKGISRVYNGKKDDAVVSKKFNNIVETNRLEVRKKTKATYFISSLIPSENVIEDVMFSESEVSLKLNEEKYVISLYE